MAAVLRYDRSHLDGHCRRVAGVQVSSQGTHLSACLVAAKGVGLGVRAEVLGAVHVELPRETVALVRPVLKADSCPAGTLAIAANHLAEVEAAAIHDLLSQPGTAADEVLALGVHDPGFWAIEQGEPAGYVGLCDAARLAELTGITVIDAFPARDLAQGGLGGPLTALPEWFLLQGPDHSRVLLDLGRTVRMTYVPAARAEGAASRISAFEVGPGMAMLDQLVHRLSGGQHPFDPGGGMAAQGRRIDPLIEHWLNDPYFRQPLPRWHCRGVRPERFLGDALKMAVDSEWSVRDLLCTATHFVAETVESALRQRLPEDAIVDEIILIGGGQHNGMLLRELSRRVAVPLVRLEAITNPAMAPASASAITPLGLEEVLGPASIALLALMCLDQVPGNPTAVTGARVPRPLGRLTPGSPQNWQRLLRADSSGPPMIRPLRSAI
jgi:anhydro-N-acetylmuramic acid kinase